MPPLVVGLAIVAYILFLAKVGRFTGTDEIAFKAAGREWARSGRFASPELKGFLHLQPPVETAWFAQLPLYTFLFGAFVKSFGFSAVSNVLFDGFIRAGMTIATYFLVLDLSRRPNRWLAAVAGLLVLCVGEPGRADELACLWGLMAGLQLKKVEKWKRSALFGVFLGLCASTSLVAGVVFLLIFAPCYVRSVGGDGRKSWRSFVATVVGGSLAAAVTILPFLAVGHQVYRQFLTHASQQFDETFKYAARFSIRYGAPFWCVIAGSVVVSVDDFLLSRKSAALGRWIDLWAGALAALLLLMVSTLSKPYYLWFLGPWMLAASFACLSEKWRAAWTPVVVAAMSLAFAAACIPFLQSSLIAASLPPDQRLAANVSVLKAAIPKGSSILASEFWSSLGNDYRYFSAVHSEVDPRSVDFVILTGNGSGVPGRPQSLGGERDGILRREFQVVLDRLSREPARILGIRLSRSAYGFGPLLLRNRRAAGNPEFQ